ncbi:hypothetical protein HPE56_08910 [Maribacter sp. ANRC-HE7]|uniref:Hydrazine synthase alpha subunit middle domain-containing protein n=1 Tax=Maribacter aquimaris TaxID=2737171 RepID=A0ABR7UZE8_9FLAO|nr:hypothetical protein [Maribacter aquimaris]MBD0777913.1 hypothetical protein [Maribacter aquimaris]
MFKKSPYTSFIPLLAIIVLVISVQSCKPRSLEGMIVMSQSQGDIDSPDYLSGNRWRHIPESRIVALNVNSPEEPLSVLTKDFQSACAPKISYDGNSMLFAAQQNKNDVWQIWEMDLHNLKTRQITSSDGNCIDPDYLPGDRMVFSKHEIINVATKEKGYTLYTSNLDGSNLARITYDPSTYFASTVLNDGRVVTIGRTLIPEVKDAKLMIMRPDGTKQQLFYQSEANHHLQGRVWEMDEGSIVFVEADANNEMDITSISYNRPLHSKVNMTSHIKGDFYAISPYQENKVLASYRSDKEGRFALYGFNTQSHELGTPIYKDGEYHVLEAVPVVKRDRPKKLPSEIDLNVKTALLVCQDINYSNKQSNDSTTLTNRANKLEILGMDETMATFETEEDGSFYIKVQADTPFRMQTLDGNDNVVKGPSSWLYLRPNERRGCIGCHENRELVPKNAQPLAVRKDPIPVPSPKEIDSLKRDLKM